MYRVYCLKNKKDEIVYVGYTSRSLHDRWRHHKNTFPERIDLKIELIQEVELKEQAKSLEVIYIRQYNTLSPNGLNIALGHANNSGEKLKISGIKTRFGNRPKTYEEEQKRVHNHKEGIKKLYKRIRCINTGIEYESLGHACKELDLHRSALCRVLKGQRSHTKGLRFEYVPN